MTDSRFGQEPRKEDQCYAPTIAEIQKRFDLPSLAQEKPQEGEILAIARAVFDSVKNRPSDSVNIMLAHLGNKLKDNLWITYTQERMTYPDAPLYALASIFHTERETGRKADWILWLDDDVSVPPDVFFRLRQAADPKDRPFVATVGFDRLHPFWPAVWETINNKLVRWEFPPDKGVYQVRGTGLVCALMHRSLFDRIPQPWFAISPAVLTDPQGNRDVKRGIKPDSWLTHVLSDAGIPVFVECSITTTHFGQAIPINRYTAPILRGLEMFGNRNKAERQQRGQV